MIATTKDIISQIEDAIQIAPVTCTGVYASEDGTGTCQGIPDQQIEVEVTEEELREWEDFDEPLHGTVYDDMGEALGWSGTVVKKLRKNLLKFVLIVDVTGE